MRVSVEPDAPGGLSDELFDGLGDGGFIGEVHYEIRRKIDDGGFCPALLLYGRGEGFVLPDMREVRAHQYQVARGVIFNTIPDDSFPIAFFDPDQFAELVEMKGTVEMELVHFFYLDSASAL